MLQHPYPPLIRQSGIALCLVFFCLTLGLVCSLPFTHESSSLLYKFGTDRILLLSAKLCGILSAFLLLIQFLLASRLKILDHFFGLDRLLNIHRSFALLLLLAAALHPLLIVLSEGGWFIPFRLDYWPELLGMLLLISLCATSGTAVFFKSLGLRFDQWWLGHRIAAPMLMLFMGLHVLNVSETFAAGLPRNLLFAGLGAAALLWVWIRLRPLRNRKSRHEVVLVQSLAQDTTAVALQPCSDQALAYTPGQFVFVSFHSGQVSREEHPFTLASAPGGDPGLQLLVRASGDWTQTLHLLSPGDTVSLDGPFGLFSYLSCPGAEEYLFIAGGVGITPFLSMLRQMHLDRQQVRVTLLWFNQTRDRRFLDSELHQLTRELPLLHIQDIFTREKGGGKPDFQELSRRLSSCSRQAHCFICGPPKMMHNMRNRLVSLGFTRRRIHQERFAL